jgi:hypothetical protein
MTQEVIRIAVRGFLAGTVAALFVTGQTASTPERSEHRQRRPSEGLFRPVESGAPAPVLDALSGVVGAKSKIRFRLTVFATEEEAAAGPQVHTDLPETSDLC